MPIIDVEKARRENLRWAILLTLNSARPLGTSEELILSVLRPSFRDLTPKELRIELDYLKHRSLLEIETGGPSGWHADLTRIGIDLVDYTVPCEPGIARPEKYW